MTVHVWVTRTEPGASRLTAALKREQADVLNLPVLRIEPSKEPKPAGEFDIQVFVSEHAVRYALSAGFRPERAVAVGRRTQGALASAGIQSCAPAAESARGVCELILCRYANLGSVLLIRGQSGTMDIERDLPQKGFRVEAWPVYQRVRTNMVPRKFEPDVIVASSGDGVRAVADSWLRESISSRSGTLVVVPSQRVVDIAVKCGFANVACSDGASPEAVVETLRLSSCRG